MNINNQSSNTCAYGIARIATNGVFNWLSKQKGVIDNIHQGTLTDGEGSVQLTSLC